MTSQRKADRFVGDHQGRRYAKGLLMAQSNSSKLIINIADLLNVHRVEKQRVEFKRSWNTGPTSWQVLHTICAFANDFLNDDGGYIILGVNDKPSENGNVNVEGINAESLDKAQGTITKLCKAHIKPEYQPRLSPEVYEGKHLLVIWATPSENGPHQCRESANGNFQYYIRKATSTVKATPEEESQLMSQHSKTPFDERMAIDRGKRSKMAIKFLCGNCFTIYIVEFSLN